MKNGDGVLRWSVVTKGGTYSLLKMAHGRGKTVGTDKFRRKYNVRIKRLEET